MSKFSSVWVLIVIFMISWTNGIGYYSLKRLGEFNVNREFITMSGVSSGGTFAQQMFVAHSTLISGISVFSHTFYRCGPGNGILRDYDAACTTAGRRHFWSKTYSPKKAIKDIRTYFKKGLIDDPHYMGGKHLYVFAGTKNHLFTVDQSLKILEVFKPFIADSSVIKTRIAKANLTLPNKGKELPACSAPPDKFGVSNCGFSGALESLQFMLGHDAVRSSKGHPKLQPLIQFDQTEFFENVGRHDMDTVGYLYVPKVCKHNEIPCLLHFYFHGCSTGREFVGPGHVVRSGFLEVAEANGIIVVFPQAISSRENNIGCWDTFGVTGPLYATQQGGQVAVVKKMLDRILTKRFPKPILLNEGKTWVGKVLTSFPFIK
ncbi:uncharacterized protein LOC110860759 [Folsomia candida]|uniref:uncharacterized protein LOC110860759 n=1 Tax=Folsomia candida TaxID=158441 RepID=UPI00160558D8|nr:uncharacterized protein LOC110860759 [Folsomia candida]